MTNNHREDGCVSIRKPSGLILVGRQDGGKRGTGRVVMGCRHLEERNEGNRGKRQRVEIQADRRRGEDRSGCWFTNCIRVRQTQAPRSF